jgi:hypothetical protein
MLEVRQPVIDRTFSESSYGLRPGRRAHDAVGQAQRYEQSGRRWVVDVDLAQFFDRVNHDMLMGVVAKRITDARVRALIRRPRGSRVNGDRVVVDRHEGTPQGGPSSPLLANVLLDVGDKQLADVRSYLVGWRSYVRLADTPRGVDGRGPVAVPSVAPADAHAVEARPDDVSRAAAPGSWRRDARDRRPVRSKLVARSGTQSASHRPARQVLRLTRSTPAAALLILNSLNRRMRTRMSGGVGGEQESLSLSPTPHAG